MATWPASLPQKQFLGLTERDQDAVLRTAMDAGPPTRRNRFTSITREVNVPIVVTGTQKQTFDTFFRTTLANGALEFDWEDPVTDATVSFAFRSPPRWTLTRGGDPSGDPTADRIWTATLELEIQP